MHCCGLTFVLSCTAVLADCGELGTRYADGVCVLRAWQYWLARYQTPHHRLQSGIDAVLHVLDWVPVRLAGVVYALIGHGEKALPARFCFAG